MFPCSFFHHHIESLPGYKNKISYLLHKGISFCTRQKASLTLEAAVVFPLATGFFVSILFLFQILQVQMCVEQALFYAGKKTALESCLVDSESTLKLSAKVFFLYALEEYEVPAKQIMGGVFGISLSSTEISDEDIRLKASYYMKLPIRFFGIRYFPITQKNVFRKWNGTNMGVDEQKGNSYVYVTPSGNAYHKTSSCRSLDLSIQKTSMEQIANLRGADGQKYYACSLCNTATSAGMVYYTKYGYLYHTDIGCSAIKRTILKRSINEVGSRTACKYCY